MMPVRVAAGAAGAVTALLLQATLIAPLTMPVAVSLPAVLVAAVALREGAATGMSLGFVAGLLADLASTHPAGVLALSWLGIGVGCGLLCGRRSARADAAVAAVVCAAATLGGELILMLVHAGGATAASAVRDVVPTVLGDALLALVLVPVVRWFLASDALRGLRPVTEIKLGTPHG